MKLFGKSILSVALSVCLLGASAQKVIKPAVLKYNDYKHYVNYFNKMEDENIVQAIPNAQSWEWMTANIPLFDCPQDNFREIYYFRWWSLRKHIKNTEQGRVLTEFLVKRSYADKYNLISSALGHHIYEARWLHDQSLLDNYIKVWYRGNGGKPLSKLHGFSSWTTYAVYDRWKVNRNNDFIKDITPDLIADYGEWEKTRRHKDGLFWQTDVKDAMEETISGGRREQNPRPTINSYMYANALALSKMETLNGNSSTKDLYTKKADTIKQLLQTKLWNGDQQFFETWKEKGDTSSNVKEAIGFIPWYFNIPDAKYSVAWQSLNNTKEFCAPFGLTTADRSHPLFRTHGCCKCEWDGAVWPFATSQTLTAMANLLNNYEQNYVSKNDYYTQMNTYVESQYYRGRPYIGEYLDEKTGYWLKGDEERSRYYNHSTFGDLIITGLVGLQPQEDNSVVLQPNIPQDKWDWFCLDNVLYNGKNLTIIWDKDGKKYKKGQGFTLLVNGKKVVNQASLGKMVYTF